MATRDVASFVCQYANNFIRRFSAHEQSGVNKEALPSSHEGVYFIIFDNINMNGRWVKTSRFENGFRIEAQQSFNFSITNERN